MQLKTTVAKYGGSLFLLIPPSLIEYLSIEPGKDVIIIEDKIKSKGRFAAFWKNEDKK